MENNNIYNNVTLVIYTRGTIVNKCISLTTDRYKNDITIDTEDILAIKSLLDNGIKIILIDDNLFPVNDLIYESYSLKWLIKKYAYDYVNGCPKNNLTFKTINNELELYTLLDDLNTGDNKCIYYSNRPNDLYALTKKCFIGFASFKLCVFWTLKGDSKNEIEQVNHLLDDYPMFNLKTYLYKNLENLLSINTKNAQDNNE